MGDRAWSLSLSLARAISPNFGVMEQQSGANGWDFRMMSPMPKPGQMRMWTMQSIAHGADFVSYFRWRTCGYGTEIYWHGLNDYSNRPNRRLAELMQTHKDLQAIEGIAGAAYRAEIALAQDYLNEWDGERDQWHGPLDRASRNSIFAAAQRSHTPLDLLSIRHTDTHTTQPHELSRYKLIFYPHATILTEETARLLRAYVASGGTLVMGARTGYKDAYGRCPMRPMPGLALPICGAEVTDYTFARGGEPVQIVWNGAAYDAPTFHDILTPADGGEGNAVYRGSHYDGACAMTVKRYPGGGAAYYLGSGFDEGIARALIEKAGLLTPYTDWLACPPEVELSCREKDGVRYFFAINYTGEPRIIRLNRAMLDAFYGREAHGELTLPPYDARVFVCK